MQFLFESPHVECFRDLAVYAEPSFARAAAALLEAALDLTRRIHADFKFDPKATSVSTPLREVLAKRRGVCQDFAHFMIGCLRTLGLPARYVSGYILTTPPPGRPRLVGADASHAWVSVYCGAARGLGRPRSDQQLPGRRRARHARLGPRLQRRHADARRDPRRRRAGAGSPRHGDAAVDAGAQTTIAHRRRRRPRCHAAEAFFRGVLCNILVCMAVWMALAGRSVVDKAVAIVFPISAFVAAGFEH